MSTRSSRSLAQRIKLLGGSSVVIVLLMLAACSAPWQAPSSSAANTSQTTSATSTATGAAQPTPPAATPTPTSHLVSCPACVAPPSTASHPSVHQVVVQQVVSGTSTAAQRVIAACPAGELALNGGWITHPDDGTGVHINYSGTWDSSSWQVQVWVVSGASQVVVYVECLTNAPGATVADRTGSLLLVPPNSAGTASVSCNAGEVPVGAGYYFDHIHLLYSLVPEDPSAWAGAIWNTSSYSNYMGFHAICLTLPGAHSAHTWVQSTSGSATADCPSGSYVTGGGFTTNKSSTANISMANGNGWQIGIYPSNPTLTAYAECLSFS